MSGGEEARQGGGGRERSQEPEGCLVLCGEVGFQGEREIKSS